MGNNGAQTGQQTQEEPTDRSLAHDDEPQLGPAVLGPPVSSGAAPVLVLDGRHEALEQAVTLRRHRRALFVGRLDAKRSGGAFLSVERGMFVI